MNTLILTTVTRKVSTSQTPKEYLDFFVSGKSLKTMLNIETSDYITLLGWGANQKYNRHILNVFRLKEKSELPKERVMIYVCPQCGDIGCGAITATIKDFGNRIIWKDFGYENSYDGLSEKYESISPIEFSRASYFAAFSKVAGC